jgi:hypothetical protein
MLPILRMTPVGGVLIAIVALVLGFTAPGLSRTRAARVEPPARGVLIEQAQHPEWRQFLILAAFQRADELSRLRDLPDNPVRSVPLPTSKPVTSMPKAPLPATEILPAVMVPPPAKDAAKDAAPVLAGLPVDRQDADPDDATGTISATPEAAIPVDIGEASSTELPVSKQEEKPPVIRTPELISTPERAKPPGATRRKVVRHARRGKPPAKPDVQQIDFFGALFNNQQNATNKQAGK